MAHKRPRAAFEADLQTQQSPYVFYGTPLPPLDTEVRDDGSYVPVWKQEVRDEQGRKRLHGAFTGGFSAGYFNTVGTKEGWSPSAFISSRSNRHHEQSKKVQQRPEDFMDEEDLAEAADAQKLQTASLFAGLGSEEEHSPRTGILTGLMKTPADTVGIRLLQKMGWRVGQGIGPRVRRKARLDEGNGPLLDEEKDQMTHLFAPENSRMISFTRKFDHKGLGFEAELLLRDTNDPASLTDDGVEEQASAGLLSSLGNPRQKRKSFPGKGGFGVGILNDNGSDDEDPYEMGPRIAYNRVIGPERKFTKPKNARSVAGTGNPLLSSRPVFVSKKATSRKTSTASRACHDGLLPLNGFMLAKQQNFLNVRNFKPPQVPPGWASSRKPASSDSTRHGEHRSVAEAAKTLVLDPKTRAGILGEVPLPGKSVFDYLSPAARDRLAFASGRKDLPQALGEAPPAAYRRSPSENQKDLWGLVPPLSKEVASAALSRGIGGWMPYAEDDAKRVRYRAFLELHTGLRDALPERPSSMSVAEWAKELEEFAHAANVFKPVTGMMASRFTSASSQPVLASDSFSTASDSPLFQAPAKKPEDPAVEAARLGMYGPMTRSTQQFLPTRLVCKRFNVKPPANVRMDSDPNHAVRSSASGAHLEMVSRSSIDQMLKESFLNLQASGEYTGSAWPPREEKVVVDVEKNDALESEKAGAAVFRAIFGSEDEEEGI